MNTVIDKAKLILEALNIELDEKEEKRLSLVCDIETEGLLNYINDIEVPKGLTYTLANRVVGKFLLNKINLGRYEEISNLTSEELLQVVNIKEYETTIQYGKNESAFNDRDNLVKALNLMIEYDYSELNRHRRITWT